ncbi:class I glutamine amidotransferase-like protein [Thamnocephalis sphaerospora]|uniref:D-lactate dehydratase n=1 Tax=Thamnocephalis sphaerospora TaxID=78915 RepID=A0A4P9XPK8_9FUNG|nr:class I glutamine amidotransferase-like protein [Thamnocephalis sphaerospora]|eukprot:RKP07943.1 class I glutamine amidotransferase-like protein [Thamnocephalis sphaerospora]
MASTPSRRRSSISDPPKKGTLLFILTSHGQLGDTGKATGYYLPELAHPYSVLIPHYYIRFATPEGGRSPVDPASVEAYRGDQVCASFLASPQVAAAVENTDRLSDLDQSAIDELDGVFFPGGHGPMFDLAHSPTVHTLVRQVYEHGGVIGAVCHGPAGLVNVKLSDGQRFLVDSHEVTGFSNEEEDAVGLVDVMPFLLEDQLRAHGGIYSKAKEPWSEHVAGRGTQLVTGQNPSSSNAVAEAMLASLNARAHGYGRSTHTESSS